MEAGGEEAAQILRSSVANYVQGKLTDLNPDTEMVVRVYANLRGLGKALADNTILEHHEDLGRFVCGFNKKYPLFDFVDAGNGKECSDAKLKSGSSTFSHESLPFLCTEASNKQNSSSSTCATSIASMSFLVDPPTMAMLDC